MEAVKNKHIEALTETTERLEKQIKTNQRYVNAAYLNSYQNIISRLEKENQSINEENNEMRQINDSANKGKTILEKKNKATTNQLQVTQMYN